MHVEANREAGSCRVSMDIGGPHPLSPSPRMRVNLEPGKVERGLLKLVLALIELIRQVMEKQAMRRIDDGSLSSEEIERLGAGLMELETKILELQEQFEIDDLNIDLGPIGKLLD
jgi:gas vesicle protein GvpK